MCDGKRSKYNRYSCIYSPPGNTNVVDSVDDPFCASGVKNRTVALASEKSNTDNTSCEYVVLIFSRIKIFFMILSICHLNYEREIGILRQCHVVRTLELSRIVKQLKRVSNSD